MARKGAVRDIGRRGPEGVRIGVKEGSAYDLYLTRTIQNAEVVRGVDGTDVPIEQSLDVAAGAPLWAAFVVIDHVRRGRSAGPA